MPQLTCIAKLETTSEHKSLVRQELIKLLAPTRKEAGCVNYDMHVDNTSENLFFFHETWDSEEDLNNHLESIHIKSCFEIIGDLLTSVDISRLSKVDL